MRRKTANPIGKWVLITSEINARPLHDGLPLTGKIVSFFPEKKIAVVRLKDRSRSACSAEKLLLLNTSHRIFKALVSGLLDGDTCKTVLHVYRLMMIKKYAKALKIAYTHKKASAYCLENCLDWIIRRA